MRSKIIIIVVSLVSFFPIVSCYIDNYEEPGETLTGQLTDIVTGKPFQTQMCGCFLEIEELSWSDNPVPMQLIVKPDGTFRNTKMFAGRYRITPVDGAFIPLEGKEVEIKGNVEVNFDVEPFLNVEITNFVQSGNDVIVSLKISSKSNLYKVLDAQIFVSNTNFVNDASNIWQLKKSIELSSVPNEVIYATTYTQTVTGLESGRTYFIRAGARCDDPISKRYNYTEVRKITIP